MNTHKDVIVQGENLNDLYGHALFIVLPGESESIEKMILKAKLNEKYETKDEEESCSSYDELDSIFSDMSFLN